MDLRQLTTFRAVAQTLSFTRAADALDYAQSSVTAQVQALEEEFGVPLFERLGKRIILTDAGDRLLAYAERLLNLAEEARAVVPAGEAPRGTLTVGASESLCAYRLPPVLAEYRRRFPQVQLLIHPGTCAELASALYDGRMDLALLLDALANHGNLASELLVPEPMQVLAYPGHPLAARKQVGPGDLAGEPVLVTEVGCGYRDQFLRSLAAVDVRPSAVMEFGSIEAIKQCVMAGMGLTLLPAVTVASEVAQRRLVPLRWAGPNFRVVTQMVWHKDKWISPALRAFLDLASAMLGERKQVEIPAHAGANGTLSAPRLPTAVP